MNFSTGSVWLIFSTGWGRVNFFHGGGCINFFHGGGLSFSTGGVSFSTGGGRSRFKGVIGRSDQKSVINQWVSVNPLESLGFW